jgi:hypothetical protein
MRRFADRVKLWWTAILASAWHPPGAVKLVVTVVPAARGGRGQVVVCLEGCCCAATVPLRAGASWGAIRAELDGVAAELARQIEEVHGMAGGPLVPHGAGHVLDVSTMGKG